MKRLSAICFAVFLGLSMQARDAASTFQLIPRPQEMKVYAGKGIHYDELSWIRDPVGDLWEVLPEMLRSLDRQTGRGVDLVLTEEDVPVSEEGYRLEVSEEGVRIYARGRSGLFYGCQTLEQLMEDSRDFNVPIPFLTIRDWPDVAFRSVHIAYLHHIEKKSYFYKLIDEFARYKVNAFIFELEDKFRYTSHPELGVPDGFTREEMMQLCEYAHRRNIEIDPLVQGLGHAGYILKHHPELKEQENDQQDCCPSEERTYEMLFDLYREALDAMPYARYLHVGGDEVRRIGQDERCKARKLSKSNLQLGWLYRVCNYATMLGKTPIYWDDMLLKNAKIWNLVIGRDTVDTEEKWTTGMQQMERMAKKFPKNGVLMRWYYQDPTKNPLHVRLIDWYGKKKLPVMGATSAAAGDSPFMPRDTSRLPHIRKFCQLVSDARLKGVTATFWSDGGPHPEFALRGFSGLGEFGWNAHGRTVAEFVEAHAQREYGFRAGEHRMDFVPPLEKAFDYYDTLFVVKGTRNPGYRAGNGFVLMDLPDPSRPGAWNRRYATKLEASQRMVETWKHVRKDIAWALKHALRNEYTLRMYEQNNEQQVFDARLLLALSRYDGAGSQRSRQKALSQITALCEEFPQVRERLEQTYGETRIMSMGPDYVPLRTGHLASQSEDYSWNWFYEIPMVENVRHWVSDVSGR